MSAYQAITSTTLSSNASSFTFTSIPTIYRDLVIVVSARLTVNTERIALMRFNAGTTLYQGIRYFSNGNLSNTGTDFFDDANGFPVGTGHSNEPYGVSVIEVFDYSTSGKSTTALCREHIPAEPYVASRFFRYGDRDNGLTSSVTSISFTPLSGSIASGSTFSLYGIEG
jgi:hypothetical protein